MQKLRFLQNIAQFLQNAYVCPSDKDATASCRHKVTAACTGLLGLSGQKLWINSQSCPLIFPWCYTIDLLERLRKAAVILITQLEIDLAGLLPFTEQHRRLLHAFLQQPFVGRGAI